VLESSKIPKLRYWYRRSRFRIVTLFTYLSSQILLYRALNIAKPDRDSIIYVNTLLPFGAAIWAKRHKRRVIVHIHEVSISPNILQRFLVRIVEVTADLVVYVSDDNRERLPVRGVDSTIISNPISDRIATEGFSTPYIPRRSGQFIALMLASPRDFKGIPELINLAARFSNRQDVKFVLVLNADQAEQKQYLSGKRLPRNLEIHSRTSTPEEFYRVADVLLNLSRVDQWVETFGLTIVEGMAFGLPVVVPPIGGPKEIVTDGLEGFTIDSRELDALEGKVRMLADDPRLTLVMSEAARHRANDFTYEKFARSLRDRIAASIRGSRLEDERT
jgi:glycosyltransferase involved in cell wall biosynthesis